jgi:YHS domain-containing protein
MRQWIKGDPNNAVVYDGKAYYFPGAEQVAMFNQDPLKYVPVLGGNDVVYFAETGKRMEGKPSFGIVYQDRNYFFASEDNKKKFQSNPESFADVDLALGGECIVCRVDMNQRVPGSPDVTVMHKGIRYQFPGEDQKAMFTRSPARYVDALRGATATGPAGSSTRPPSATSQPSQPAGSGSR